MRDQSFPAKDSALFEDFWKRVDAIPKRYAYVVEEGGKVTYHGPFDSREACEEYADNSDVNVTGFIEMQHPDDLIAAIEENHKAFPR